MHLLFGWLRERERRRNSCAVIGYPSGKMGRSGSCPLGISRDFLAIIYFPGRKRILLAFMINPLLTKLNRSTWRGNQGLVLFLRVYGPQENLANISCYLDLSLGQ